MKKLWCFICDVCTLVTYMPITAKGKKNTLHFCKQACYDKWFKRKKKK